MKFALTFAGALPALSFLALAGCALSSNSADGKTTIEAPEGKAPAALVAPVFSHGAGVYAGKDFYAMPENAALAVIEEELQTAGVDVSSRNAEFKYILVKGRVEAWNSLDGRRVLRTNETGDALTVDFYDAKKSIAIAFLGIDSKAPKRGEIVSFRSFRLAGDCDLKETAEYLSGAVAKQGKGFVFGAFYDPLTAYDELPPFPVAKDGAKQDASAAEIRESQKMLLLAISKERLRAQVRDFVEWLKFHGKL